MTGKIKYVFHELRTQDRNKYARMEYKTNLRLRKRKIEYRRNYAKEHKAWRTLNCTICGKFCRKGSRKYCSYCQEMMFKTRSIFQWWRLRYD